MALIFVRFLNIYKMIRLNDRVETNCVLYFCDDMVSQLFYRKIHNLDIKIALTKGLYKHLSVDSF